MIACSQCGESPPKIRRGTHPTHRPSHAPVRSEGAINADLLVIHCYSIASLCLAFMSVILDRRRTSPSPNDASSGILTFQDVTLDREAYLVRRAGRRITLSTTSFHLLRLFMERSDKIHTRQEILDRLKRCETQTCQRLRVHDPHTVDDQVYRLRRSLGTPNIIRTVAHVGYGLDEPVL